MNRRGFLGRLAAALATATVARKLPAAEIETPIEPGGLIPMSHVVSAGGPYTATYQITMSRMTAGIYTGTFCVPHANSGVTTIPVTFMVSET